MYHKGLSRIIKEQSQRRKGSIRLRLQEGDSALIYIASDGEEDGRLSSYASHWVQNFEENRGRSVLCKQYSGLGDCQYCAEGDNPARRLAFWAYVFYVDHRAPGPEGSDWKEGRVGGKIVYRETVKDFQILEMGYGRSNVTLNQLKNYYDRFGRLDDRRYRVTCHGSGFDKYHDFFPADGDKVVPPSEELVAVANNLPGVIEFLSGQSAGPSDVRPEVAPTDDSGADLDSVVELTDDDSDLF